MKCVSRCIPVLLFSCGIASGVSTHAQTVTTGAGPGLTQASQTQTTGTGSNSTASNPTISQSQRNMPPAQSDPKDTKQQQAVPQRGESLSPLSPPEPLTGFQRLISTLDGEVIPIFGASLFQDVPSTFAPVDEIPVSSDYVVGPGDELRIQLFGQVNLTGRYVVDRSGNVLLPEIGSVHVAGLQYADLHNALQTEFSRVYRNFDLNVQMGDLRSIQIFVVGKVRRPGSFTVSALSTMVNALFASGGPSPSGSLRTIQLKRDGKVVGNFDLYDLLLHGDKSKDLRLLPGDVIYVPPVGMQVALLGSVNQAAIYELKDESTVGQILALSGGLSTTAGKQTVRIERINDHRELAVSQAPLTPEGEQTPVRDGDILTFPSIQDRFRNAVTLRGNVANPGRYSWHEGLRLRDLIPDKESLITANYWKNHNNLGLISSHDYESAREGALTVSSRIVNQTAGTGAASISEAQSATDSKFIARNDVVLSAADIDWGYAVIERLDAQNLHTTLIPFNLGQLILDGDDSQNLPLQSGDVVTIFSDADIEVPQSQRTRFVRLEGEVVSAGVYSVRPGESLADLVVRAGGLTKDAYLFGSTFTRESTRTLQQQRLDEYVQQLQNELQQTSLNAASRSISPQDTALAAAARSASQAAVDRLARVKASGRIVLSVPPNAFGVTALPYVALEDGDRFVVPRLPSEVSVEGAVFNQNSFLFVPGVRVGQYIRKAGGPTRAADPKKAFVIRADGSLLSRQYVSKHQFESTRLYPGDTIVVPERIERQSALRNLVYLGQIIGQFGLGAAAVSVLQ